MLVAATGRAGQKQPGGGSILTRQVATALAPLLGLALAQGRGALSPGLGPSQRRNSALESPQGRVVWSWCVSEWCQNRLLRTENQ